MTFKETLARDLSIFVELKEYGELIDLNGVKLAAQVIKHTANRKQGEIANKNDEFYVHPEKHNIRLIGDYITIHFRTQDYVKARERIPRNTEYIHLNGSRYRVEDSQDEFGLTSLVCTAERMNTLTPQMARAKSIFGGE